MNDQHDTNGTHLPAKQEQYALTDDRVDLLKRTIAKGATNDEFGLFVAQCRRTGLDPFSSQICLVKRWNADERREVMTIQVQIHGLRLIADRTGRYAPGRKTEFEIGENNMPVSATAYVKKLVSGQWHEFGETAFFDEYAQTKKDGSLTRMWATKPRLMLAKCAEALALRRAFPHETSGLYTPEEMSQADTEHVRQVEAVTEVPLIGEADAQQIRNLLARTGADTKAFLAYYGVSKVEDLPADKYQEAHRKLTKKLAKMPQPDREPGVEDDAPFEEAVS